MNIKDIFLIIIVTFLITASFIPVVKKIAEFIGAMDVPNARKVHTKPIPRLGGLGIYTGFLLGYMLFGLHSIQMNAILIGSFIILVTGIFDDIKPVPAKWKFLAQTVGASIVPLYGGILLQDISAFGLYFNFGVFAYPITILFIVSVINCINLIDGLDGLSSGIASIYFLTVGIIGLLLNHFGGLDIILTFIMLGSTLGFLLHNFNPAKIFMGDSGSMFLGYIIAVIHNAYFDKGTDAEAAKQNGMIHPTTGLPITSHQAALVDMSNYKGNQNVRIVRQKGQAYKAKVIEGMTDIPACWGLPNTNHAATEIDMARYEVKGSIGLQVDNTTKMFLLKCVL